MAKVVNARKRDVNAKNAPDWSKEPRDDPFANEPSLVDPIDEVEVDFQTMLDISAARGKPITSPADSKNPTAAIKGDGLSEADRGAAMREQRPIGLLGRD